MTHISFYPRAFDDCFSTRDAVSARANNFIVDTARYASDPEPTALLASYQKFAAPLANRRAGTITETRSHRPDNTGESRLGDIIADAQLAATCAPADGGAVIAFTNPGGIRTDIVKKQDGAVAPAPAGRIVRRN